jgi:hypothetical protein
VVVGSLIRYLPLITDGENPEIQQSETALHYVQQRSVMSPFASMLAAVTLVKCKTIH